MITTQAKRVREALRSLGLTCRTSWEPLRVRDFSVRTEGSGTTDKGFGDASAVLYSSKARATAYDGAETLIKAGCSVTRWTSDGVKYVIVSSHYPPRLRDLGDRP